MELDASTAATLYFARLYPRCIRISTPHFPLDDARKDGKAFMNDGAADRSDARSSASSCPNASKLDGILAPVPVRTVPKRPGKSTARPMSHGDLVS